MDGLQFAEVDEDDPDKIKDNLMDLCDHKKEELVVRHSIDKMQRHSRKKNDRIIGKEFAFVFYFSILYKLLSVSLYFYCIRFLNNLCEFKYKNNFYFIPCCTQTFG